MSYGSARGDELPPELANPRTRRERLREAKRRLDEEHAARQTEMAAWERARADYTARTGLKRKGRPIKPRPIPPKEAARINTTDPDSRPVKTARGFIQGYAAQAVRAPSVHRESKRSGRKPSKATPPASDPATKTPP